MATVETGPLLHAVYELCIVAKGETCQFKVQIRKLLLNKGTLYIFILSPALVQPQDARITSRRYPIGDCAG